MARAGLFRTKPKLSAKVLIGVATLPKFANYIRHKANNDFLHSCKALKLGEDPFISIRDNMSLVVGAVVDEHYYAIKGDSLRIRREGDDPNVNCRWEGFRVSKGDHRTRLIQKK
jgi:hypothetical protein